MIVEAIRKVVEQKDLTSEEAASVMEEIMSGKATEAQIASFLTALRMKGETVDEISEFAKVMRAHAIRISPKVADLADTCGTGGDVSHTFNISTVTAFVASGAGVHIAKHGNRSVSSRCGSADVLEALGVKIDLSPKVVEACIDEVGIGFLFAPLLHPAMKYATPVRRNIGIRTVFNILGPLTNPAFASAQILGVYDPSLAPMLAKVLGNLGVTHALVVHGDGLDELTNTGESCISELVDGKVKNYRITPEQFDLPRVKVDDLRGGTVKQNAQIMRSILSGERGPRRDIVLLNAAAALVAADKAKDLGKGLKLAAESIDSGAALEKLEKLMEFTNKMKG
ncbi:MAG: anthranilate phosphoribosyltransferase [Actinomycetota bacterium]|nr:anthranilate phosphoribosyltransferase [Actinomycetota bacterium]MDI6821633.1 anthranilate phosphoribosyltransferase [Actinomycetota bacterium]